MFEFLKKKSNAKDVQTYFNKAKDDIMNNLKGKKFPEGALTILREKICRCGTRTSQKHSLPSASLV